MQSTRCKHKTYIYITSSPTIRWEQLRVVQYPLHVQRNSPLSRRWTKCIERQEALISIKFTSFGSIPINDFINVFDALCVIEFFLFDWIKHEDESKTIQSWKNAWFCFCLIFVQSQSSDSLCKSRLDIATPLPCCKCLYLAM